MPLLKMNQLGEIVTMGFNSGDELKIGEPNASEVARENASERSRVAYSGKEVGPKLKKLYKKGRGYRSWDYSEDEDEAIVEAAPVSVPVEMPAPAVAEVAAPVAAVAAPVAAVAAPVAAVAAPAAAAEVTAPFSFKHPMELQGLTSSASFKALVDSVAAALAAKAAVAAPVAATATPTVAGFDRW